MPICERSPSCDHGRRGYPDATHNRVRPMQHKPNQEISSQDRNKPTPDQAGGDNALPDRNRGTPAVSAVLPDGHLVEMVFDPVEQRTRFVLWQDGAWRFAPIVRTPAGERLLPYSPHNNLIKKEVVLFPSEPCEYGSEADLVGDIQASSIAMSTSRRGSSGSPAITSCSPGSMTALPSSPICVCAAITAAARPAFCSPSARFVTSRFSPVVPRRPRPSSACWIVSVAR